MVLPELLEEVPLDPATGAFSLESWRGPMSGRLDQTGLELRFRGYQGERRERFEPVARVENVAFALAPRTSYQEGLEWARSVVPLARPEWRAEAGRSAPG